MYLLYAFERDFTVTYGDVVQPPEGKGWALIDTAYQQDTDVTNAGPVWFWSRLKREETPERSATTTPSTKG